MIVVILCKYCCLPIHVTCLGRTSSLPLQTYWGGHQISPTVLSLKGRLPQKLQFQTLFLAKLLRNTVCFVIVLYKKNIDVFCSQAYVTDLKKKYSSDCKCFSTVDTKQTVILIFSSFIFCSVMYLFEEWKLKAAYSCSLSKDSLDYSSSLFTG